MSSSTRTTCRQRTSRPSCACRRASGEVFRRVGVGHAHPTDSVHPHLHPLPSRERRHWFGRFRGHDKAWPSEGQTWIPAPRFHEGKLRGNDRRGVRLRRTGALVVDSPQDEGCPRITGRPRFRPCHPSGRAEGLCPSAFLVVPHDWGIKGVETEFMRRDSSLDSRLRGNDNERDAVRVRRTGGSGMFPGSRLRRSLASSFSTPAQRQPQVSHPSRSEQRRGRRYPTIRRPAG